ncbi:MAG: DUF4876 domain-containing protein [Ignavibacteria bacterium]|nr:DUF4876 domain-containing protein [Ignavibacteria bacterium]MDH7526802.1 DUF4876 domain-containing protein [Ignavibacteria bacterium]
MKRILQISLLLISSISIFSCSQIVDFESKPVAMERKQVFRIRLVDQSGYMMSLFGSDAVRNAQVFLKSNLLGEEYNLVTDTNGVVEISGIVSDKYLVSASRIMSPDEMELITGYRISNHKLMNKTVKIIQLRADADEIIEVPMDVVIGGSPIVISEIYACGPPGSGLYYHDKYVEVYNQTDSVIYLDGIIVAVVYASSYLGQNYVDDPEFVHSKNVWIFPGNGTDYPLYPGEFAVCAEDAIDHRINAPNSVDLSNVKFEFYKDDAPDIDNPLVPNMIKIYQSAGNDWLIGGEQGAIVIAKMPIDSLQWFGDQLLIPYRYVLDGVEYLKDPMKLENKILNHSIDGGGTGGIQFYTGKSMERIALNVEGRMVLKDDNNSSVDFVVINKPTPEFHYTKPKKRK